MPLTLTILSFKGQPAPHNTVVTINDTGGTIGRSDHNTLVLHDSERFVSRQHATISVKNGGYYLTDSSLSGVFIDGQQQALHNSSQQIFDGTRLKMGEYELVVSIIDADSVADFPFIQQKSSVPPLLPPDDFLSASASNVNSLLSDNHNSTFVSHQDLLQGDNLFQTPIFESKLQGNQSPIFDSYIPPNITRPVSAIDEIPENFSFEDLLADVTPVKTSAPQTQTDDAFMAALDAAVGVTTNEINQPLPETETVFTPYQSNNDNSAPAISVEIPIKVNLPDPTLTHNAVFAAFLQGAGISNFESEANQCSDIMQRAGQMFRILVDGTVALLRSRAEFKSLFRANMTVIKSTNNNPLKFSVSSHDVLQQLLENKSGSFLDSTTSIEEGFSDIMNHQLAMQAGIQASLTDLLKTFDPKLIEQEFEQGLVLQKKSKCWDKFSETYQNTVDNAVEDFFGDAFIQAYEAQIRALTAQHLKK